MENKIKENDDDPRFQIYETGYLLVPAIAKEEIQDKAESIRNIIKSAGGEIVAEGDPVLRDLEYEMSVIVSNKKEVYNSGYFGWVKFKGNPASIGSIQAELKKDTEIIRFIVVKTVLKDTLAEIKKILAAESEEKIKAAVKEKEKVVKLQDKKEVSKPISPASEEEIDKTIEKLIIE